MDFRILPPSPQVVCSSGRVLRLGADGGMSDLVLPAPFRPLLRLLIASATVPAEEGEQSLGLPVTQRLAKEVVPGTSPKRLARAVSQVRGFLTSTGERAVVESRSLGGKRGAADGGGRQQTDEAFVRTVEYDGQTAYRFVLHAEDTIDWVQCLRELASASQILAAGGTTESKEIAKRWRRVLEQTDLDLAFDVPNNNIWQNSDRDAVWAARLRTYRILSIAGSPSPDSLVLAQKVLHQDRSSKFYDGPLAEAAIRSLFVVERSRDQVIAGFRDFVDKPDVRETLDLIALKADLSSQERWDEAQPVWAEKWGIAELDTTLVGAVQPETPPPRPGPSTRRSGPLLTPDPLTPGFSIDAMRRLGVPIDSEVAAELDAIARGAVDAVEHGDFVLQEQIGTRLAGLSGEFPDFGAAGRYFIAEGRRLQADMAKGTERIALRQAALEMYQESRELNPDSIRTIRGLARTLEVLGEPEEQHDVGGRSRRGDGIGNEVAAVLGIVVVGGVAVAQEEKIGDEFRVDRPRPGVLDLHGLGSNGGFHRPVRCEADVTARPDLRWRRMRRIPQVGRQRGRDLHGRVAPLVWRSRSYARWAKYPRGGAIVAGSCGGMQPGKSPSIRTSTQCVHRSCGATVIRDNGVRNIHTSV